MYMNVVSQYRVILFEALNLLHIIAHDVLHKESWIKKRKMGGKVGA